MTGNYIIYKHSCPNGKVYIGITSLEPTRRWQNGYGYINNKYFHNAILKYGWDNIKHEILFTNLSKEEAEAKEMLLIKLYKSNQKEYGYNIDNGGNSIGSRSNQTKEKLKQANLGKKMSEKSKEKNRQSHLGKKFTEETKLKMSISRLGKKHKCFSEETKLKMSISKSIPVICIETGAVYYGTMEAERRTGINNSNINHCLKGKRKTAGGYRWEYIKEEVEQ